MIIGVTIAYLVIMFIDRKKKMDILNNINKNQENK
jgi:hypothetical protein